MHRIEETPIGAWCWPATPQGIMHKAIARHTIKTIFVVVVWWVIALIDTLPLPSGVSPKVESKSYFNTYHTLKKI